jgi:hypothetical protein
MALTALVLAGCGGGGSKDVPVVISSNCSIDRPAPDFQASVGKAFNVTGWAFDKSGAAPVKTQVQLSSPDLKDIKLVDAQQGMARPDVAQALNAPAAASSGYDAAIAADLLPANTYSVTVIQRFPTYSLACSVARVVTVK